MQSGQNHVAGQRRLYGNFCRFEIADLADHDDVRVLSEKRAQTHCKVEPDLIVHLNLIDPVKIVFDRIFGGADVDPWLVQIRQR